jgi:hypothetical protein
MPVVCPLEIHSALPLRPFYASHTATTTPTPIATFGTRVWIECATIKSEGKSNPPLFLTHESRQRHNWAAFVFVAPALRFANSNSTGSIASKGDLMRPLEYQAA